VKKLFFLLIVVLVPGRPQVLAQDVGPIKLSLTANPPPTPALRFALLNELRDQVPGNAAPFYRQAAELLEKMLTRGERAALSQRLSDWTQTPIADLPRDEVRKALAYYVRPLELLEKATRSEYCDWELAQRLREHGVGTLLPELQPMRTASQVLSVRARLELAENRPDLALRTLRSHLTLAKHLGETSTLIGHLVGIAVLAQACSVMEQVISHPQTPSLYWSLASLPQPFLDYRAPFQGERIMAYGTFPGALDLANNLEAGPLTPEQIEKIVKAALSIDGSQVGNVAQRFLLAQMIRIKHEAAKKALIAAGRPREKVEQWPHVQVALMHALMEYDQVYDELLKCQSLPYWQMAPLGDAFEKRAKASRDRGSNDPALSLAPMLLPAVNKVTLARFRMERQLAALRCLEAIRLYAAEHKGQLPSTLAEIKDTPIPVCPVTGKPFTYRRTGDDTAILTAPLAPPKASSSIKPLTYELTLRR
jgi:hypothetical protein